MHVILSSLVKIYWDLLKLLSWNQNTDILRANNWKKNDQICPLAFPKQITMISMHIPSLVKIQWHLCKLSFGKENTDMSQAELKNWGNLPICKPKLDPHNKNADTKLGENPSTLLVNYHP